MGDVPDSISASTEQWLESASDGVAIVDTTGVIRLVNSQLEAMFGYARGEILGQKIEELVPELMRSDHRAHRAAYHRDPKTRPMGAGLDIAARHKDGSEFSVDVSLSLLDTKDGLMISTAVRDISDQMKIEARLQGLDATSRLAAIVECSEDAIIGKTLDGVITTWNAGAERMYGYAASEIIGHNVSQLVPTERLDELEAIIERVRHGEQGAHFETQRLAKDGRILDMSVTISPIRDETGAVTGASTVARDLTAMKRAEAERAALEVRLHRVQRLESLEQLAGGVAHDFNNLLAGIMNYAALVSATLQEEMDRRGLSEDEVVVTILDDVGEITKVAKRAAALTHQLLIFSRGEVVQPEVLDLNTIVGDMKELLRTTIGEHGDHQVHIVLAQDLALVKVDRSQIEQVVMNLAVNARDAMAGGGRVAIETATYEIDEQSAYVRHIEPGTYVRLTVSDTGTGMPQDVAARAFEPFFTTKPKGEGTGLGLATVYGIVTQAGGDVAIYSEPGLGTTVRVYLPATSDAMSEPRPAKPDVPLFADGETVLLVEHEDIVREPARRMLARYGYTVLAAGNTDEALEIARWHPGRIDLLLTDVVMPGRSGKELSVELLGLRPSAKVLFMSGYSQGVIAHHGVLEAGTSHIDKPFSEDDLLRKVREVLDGGP